MSCYVMTLYTGRGSSAGERTTPGQEVVGLIPALGAHSGLVESVPI